MDNKEFIFSVGDRVQIKKGRVLRAFLGGGSFVVVEVKLVVLETRQCNCGSKDSVHGFACERIIPPVLMSEEEMWELIDHPQRIRIRRSSNDSRLGPYSGDFFQLEEQ